MRDYRYLTIDDRKTLEKLYSRGAPVRAIAEQLGFHTATIYKELHRGFTGRIDKNLRPEYKAKAGQQQQFENFHKRGRKIEV